MFSADVFIIAVTFFLIMDPLGNIPLFVAILKSTPPAKKKQVILREMLIALGVMVLFFYLGEKILDILGISKYTVEMSGGLILFIIALQLIFPKAKEESEEEVEPFIVPLAVPLVAGPSILATIMVYAHDDDRSANVLAALIVAWLASTVILLSSGWFSRLMGDRGLKACERMMGLILILLAVQLFLQGVQTMVQGA